MKGLLGRTRRVLAGLVSAMMVLTSLPLTEVAVYAAPSENAAFDAVTEEASDAADAADVAVADVDEAAEAEAADEAVVDEADDTATAEDAAQVTLSFNRYGEDKIEKVTIGDKVLTFTGQTLSENVSANVTYKIKIGLDESATRSFVYAAGYVGGHAGVALERDETDPYTTFVLTPTEGMGIGIYLQEHTVSVNDLYATANYTSGVKTVGDDHFIEPGEDDIVFSLSNIPDKYISYDVSAMGGGTELDVAEGSSDYTIPRRDVNSAVFAEKDIEIFVTGKTYEGAKFIAPDNTDITFTVDNASLVSENNTTYAKRDTDYRFKAELTAAAAAAGKVVSKVSYQLVPSDPEQPGAYAPEVLTAGSEGWYSIPAEAIRTAADQNMDINIAVLTAAAKQNITFKVHGAGNITKLTYGSANAHDKSVSLDEAKKTSGATVSVNTGENQKMAVTVSDDSTLLSDSVTVDGKPAAELEGNYIISVNETAVTVDVTAYKKVKVTRNELKTAVGENDLTKIEFKSGVYGGLANGRSIRFDYGYASDVLPYDVELKAPVAYYMDGSAKKSIALTGPKTGIAGIYSIKQEDVESLIKAGKDIIVEAQGREIPKVKMTFKRTVGTSSNGLVDVEGFRFTEKDASGKEIDHYTIDPDEWDVSGNTAEFVIQKGNRISLSDFEFPSEYAGAAFTRIKKGDKEIRQKTDLSYELGAVTEDTVFTIEAATLKEDEISYEPVSDPDGLATASLNNSHWLTSDGYVRVTAVLLDKGMNLDLTIDDSADPIYKRKLKNVKYAISGGSKVDVPKTFDPNTGVEYYIPATALREAAFAKADVSGNKITITSEFEKAGTKPQDLTLIFKGGENKGAKFSVKQNDKSVGVGDSPYSYANGGSTELEYGHGATVIVKPNTGFELDKAYLIKQADLTKAGMDTVSENLYVDTLIGKLATTGAITAKAFTPGSDGSIWVSIEKVDGPYTVFATTKEKAELVVIDGSNIDESKKGKYLSPKDGVYEVYWWDTYKIGYKKGEDWVTISGNSISANNGEKAVTNELFESVSDEKILRTLSANSADLNGKAVTIEFATKDGQHKDQITFRFSRKPQDGDITFEEGVISENKIAKPQALGTTVKYIINNPKSLPIGVGTGVRPDPEVNTYLKDIKDSKGKVTKHELYITSYAKKGLMEKEIRFYDGKYPLAFQKFTVKFSTDQVTNADLSKVEASADTDSINVNFAGAKGFDKTTEGLYYKVDITTDDESDVLCGTKEVMVPATEASVTIPLTDSVDDVEPESLNYTVKVQLVQVEDLNVDGSYNDGKKIEASAVKSIPDVKTIADGVYANQIKLVKAKTAPKVIYGSPNKNSGKDTFLLATVNYPDVKKGVPVTVKRLKKLELVNSKGEVVDDLPRNPERFISEYQNNIYLNPKNLPADKYTLKAYAIEPKGVDVVATMKFTVVNAIYDIEVKTPSKTLYKVPGKKATIKATLKYNDGDKAKAPKTKKVKWYLESAREAERISVPGVTVKNGTVTFAKNVELTDELMEFDIVAEAADFDHGEDRVIGRTRVEVVTATQEPAEIYIGSTKITKNANIKSGDLTGEVRVLDRNDEEIEDITVTVTGAMKYDKDAGRYKATKLGKASITVKTADGSNKSLKIPFKVVTDTGINGMFAWKTYDSSASRYVFTNKMSPAGVLWLFVVGDDGGFVEHTVKLDGFKKTKVKGAEKRYDMYTLTPTKRNAKITIIEKAKKNNPTVLEVTNTSIPASTKAAATKITASNKIRTTVGGKIVDKKGTIFTGLDFASAEAYKTYNCNKVTYTVKYGKKAAAAGEKVRLYPSELWMADVVTTAGGKLNDGGSYDLTLGEGGKFTLDFINTATYAFDVEAGSYTFQVVPLGTDGLPAYKAATVKFKVVKTPKPTTKTLKAKTVVFDGSVSKNDLADLIFAKQANILVSENGISDAAFGAESNDMDLRGLNVKGKGKINGFADMFVIEGGKLKYTGVKSPYYTKKGISGQIAVSYTGMDGKRTYMYIPITVKGSFK